ncbi:MAG: translation initiation factor IF-2 [Bacteroidota bacterium]
MAEERMMRLSQVARKLNVGTSTIVEHLESKGFSIDNKPNTKITVEQFDMLSKEYASSAMDKEEASGLTIGGKTDNFVIDAESPEEAPKKDEEEKILIKDLSVEAEAKEPEEKIDPSHKLQGIKVVGKIDLDKDKKQEEEPVKEESPKEEEKKEEVVEATVKEEEPVKKEKKEEPKQEEVVAPETEKAKEEVKEPEEAPKNEVKEEEQEQEVIPEVEKSEQKEEKVIEAKADSLKGLTVLGKIELPKEKKKEPKPVASSDASKEREKKKRPRKRLRTQPGNGSPGQGQRPGGNDNRRGNQNRGGKKDPKEELSEKDVQEQIKATLAKLSGGKKGGVNRSKYRREKRSAIASANEAKAQEEQEESKTLKVTEFISANDLASLMDVSVNDVIAACMSLGMFVSINQRLDAEAITVIADDFGFAVEFSNEEEEVDIEEEEDSEEDLEDRAPIVTIMGHVDHGKTSLLDYIRNTNVIADEAGGITQHIGAYDVKTDDGKRIAFLDTPGHEAFTAMRARGAKLTDVAIIVVAADDAVMPQTKEAINHAQVAGVPIVIAINKVDRPNSNPDKIREELSAINVLVEDWGGKYQSQEISAKTGQGIDDLLEKVLLESELLELKANPNKNGTGTVVEASLDKGRGYVATVLVQSGTMEIGDVLLAGAHYGKVKAMFDHRGKKLKRVGPATPVQILGLDGAPQAGEKFNVVDTEREAREVTTKRSQIEREQKVRTKKHITLDEIGRRLAIGSFKELNVIVKGDVDGSIEALSDSLLKLSTDEVQVNIIHKAVGQISESDVLLASASDAVMIGFQVRPSANARRIAENEEIEIRLYSVIYDAINDVKDAMEGMLAPEVEEIITGNIEVREVFKISKVGTVAGCMVTDGYVKRNNEIRLIRDGIVVYTGNINQLKRYKEDVSEVRSGYECGISIKNFNDIKVGDVIEGFENREIKRTL